MSKIPVIIICLNLLCNVVFSQSNAQDSISGGQYLHIYIDGAGDWENYIKVKLWYVDYVRDPRMADVQVIIKSQETAAGGSEYYLFFLGKGSYSTKTDTLHFTSPVEYTNRRTRDELTNVLTMGLMPYMVLSEQYKYMVFDYTNRQKLIQQSVDKWNNWVFTVAMNTNFSADQSSTVFSGDGSLSAAQITEKWKSRITAAIAIGGNSYETSTYSYSGNTIIKNLNALLVRSVNEHWSLGLEPSYYASTYSNVSSQFSLSPGIEYDYYPYSESVNRLLTFKYRIQPIYNVYIDTTVFDKTKEFLLGHILDATYTRIESWGNLSSTLTASHYLNQPKAYRFDMLAQMNVRLAKGLFLNISGNVSLINNQLSISKKTLKPEEIILQQRETLSNYSSGFQIGIRYVFGSIYNNIVNPRYEGGVDISQEVINNNSEGNTEGAD
jgi:hypothetical protein